MDDEADERNGFYNRCALTLRWPCTTENPHFPSAILSWFSDGDNDNQKVKSLHYSVFFPLCGYICNKLIQLHNDDGNYTLDKIVVAIPEGPLLPLSVAAVHTLNATQHRSILVPLDPNHCAVLEASFANEPLTILVCGDCDYKKLEKLCAQQGQHRVVDVAMIIPDRAEVGPLLNPHSIPHPPKTSLAASIASCANIPLVDVSSSDGGTNWVSHIVFTSGTTTGRPKGCVCSRQALLHYLSAKNTVHGISEYSTVFLASSISFDPCFSDCLATLMVTATLALTYVPSATHILCTPTQYKAYDWKTTTTPTTVVALGGERVPDNWSGVYATYGVTEACVYQTMGPASGGGCVGKPFPGMGVAIWEESSTHSVERDGCEGEVVLYGKQLDDLSGYYHQPELTAERFLRIENQIYYRTGDRGYKRGDQLYIVGRIGGDDMVKYKGVRVQLHEIEQALISIDGVVDDAIVVGQKDVESNTTSVKDIIGYIVLSSSTWSELSCEDHQHIPESGLLCTCLPLLALLRSCCQRNTRVVPSAFVLLDHLPTTATGKRNRRGVPPLEHATPLSQDTEAPHLSCYGRSGAFVAQEIKDRLNLLPAQNSMMLTKASYALLGGDSLSATQIVRSLYAKHCNVRDSRHLGGDFGALEGPFGVKHFLASRTLGEYVDWLDCNNAFNTAETGAVMENVACKQSVEVSPNPLETDDTTLYDALLQSCSLQISSVAIALLEYVDPDYGNHGFRMAKTSRFDRKSRFRSSPLHLSCLHGNYRVTQSLLDHGAKYNTPNPSGLFPIHLAASGEHRLGEMPEQEQKNRLACLQCLVGKGAPVTVADGNKQSVLHAAARAGNLLALRWLVRDWKQLSKKMGFEWRDVWSRTPVHWAVLNGRPEALTILLDAGSRPNPPTPPATKVHTSLVLESPMEVCTRVHGETPLGQQLAQMLLDAEHLTRER